jgi:hypothetical protein
MFTAREDQAVSKPTAESHAKEPVLHEFSSTLVCEGLVA